MPTDMSAREVRSIVKAANQQRASGRRGACLVFRHRQRTQVTCYETTEAACELVNEELGNNGHTIFEGVGTRCSN